MKIRFSYQDLIIIRGEDGEEGTKYALNMLHLEQIAEITLAIHQVLEGLYTISWEKLATLTFLSTQSRSFYSYLRTMSVNRPSLLLVPPFSFKWNIVRSPSMLRTAHRLMAPANHLHE
jgi:hypothetical protein